MVTVFTSPGCQQCVATKKLLDIKGIDYKMVDVTKDSMAHDKIATMGYRSLPVVLVGDVHWSGFDPEKISQIAA